MVNYRLKKLVRNSVIVILTMTIFIMGFVLGNSLKSKSYTAHQHVQDKQSQSVIKRDNKTEEHVNLNTNLVKEFLIAYYTRKELSENRNRYKPFMTEGLYLATVSDEDKPINQAYKGYVVDQVFDSADIYINLDSKEVIASVHYSSKILATKNDYSKQLAHKDVEHIKLTYVNHQNKLIINKIEHMTIAKADNQTTQPTTTPITNPQIETTSGGR